ncbi:phage terminase large subunit family protein [Cupriavidus sp. DL-D2]|uniref:phage terminase large subunit family protein n=1 Tax=Cupriavidus sp. DL-D2 TaxID=3144974 RepID=UPI003214D862
MSNPYVVDFYNTLSSRYAADRISMSHGDWMCANTSLQGKKFSFARYPFQKAIADDMHPNLDCIKPSQVGLSEVQIRKVLTILARHPGKTAIFTLPNDKMFERMSTTRIKPLVEEERVFNMAGGGTKPVRSKGLMQIGKSFLFVTGATEGDATSISADIVFNDEVDLTDQTMLALFNSRLQNSDWKINQRFSTPTFEGYGVDRGFQASDQHEYLCKCPHCNHWQLPVFEKKFVDIPGMPDNLELVEIDESLIDAGTINLLDAQVVCEKCRMPLDLGNTEHRAWVAKFPNRTHARGYRVNPFSTDRLSVEYIIAQLFKYKQRDFIRGWYNTVLGLPFNAGDVRLSDADIDACFTERMLIRKSSKTVPAWIGVDLGTTCHITVGEGYSVDTIEVVEFITVPSGRLLEEIKRILEEYMVIGGTADRFPYTPTANDMFHLSAGRVIPLEYRGQKEVNLVEDVNENVMYGQANRTILIDEVARVVRRGKIRFSGYGTQRSIIKEHLKDMVRDESPEQEAVWRKLSGNDHYFHSLGFMLAAVKIHTSSTIIASDNRSSVLVMGIDLNQNGSAIYVEGKQKSNLIYGRR